MAISNIPLGDYKPFDNKFNRQGFLNHDYFFARGIETALSGGLMMLQVLHFGKTGSKAYIHVKAVEALFDFGCLTQFCFDRG